MTTKVSGQMTRGVTRYVGSVAELEALTGSTGQAVILALETRGGEFIWVAGDQSVAVANDTQQGIWVAGAGDATGASGAWKRVHKGVAFVGWFGATGSGNETSAIQGAIDSGLFVVGHNSKTYGVTGLTTSTDDQNFGDLNLVKVANGLMLSSSARDLHFRYCSFDGDGATYTGDNINLTGDNPTFDHCSSAFAAGRALLSTGSGTRIIGTNDIWHTSDTSAGAVGIELGVIGTPGLYSQIMGITMSTSAGGILLQDHGSCSITNSQIAGLEIPFGSGAYVDNLRITGDLISHGSFTTIGHCTVTGDIELGDGVNAISGLSFDSSVYMQSGSTLTINGSIQDSVIHWSQFSSASGVTVVDNLTGDANDLRNSIYSTPISFVPSWTAATTNPTIGNGTLEATYTRMGRQIKYDLTLQGGSTTNYGSGAWSFGIPNSVVAKSGFGSAKLFDAGTAFFIGVAEVDSATGNIRVYTNNAGDAVRSNIPFTWATDDTLEFSAMYES